MTSRLLPPEEWPRLAGTELETVWPQLNPACTTILVVEDSDGAIVGCWSIGSYVHVEGLWIAPTHRRAGSVGRRLWSAMRDLAAQAGVQNVITGACSDPVRALLARAGATPLPGEQYVLPMGRR